MSESIARHTILRGGHPWGNPVEARRPKGRKCEMCDTILSVYNTDVLCSVHARQG